MDKLIKGTCEYHDKVFPNQRFLFDRLQSEQTPQALFITCADSRIHPNLITQTEPGELFILRNAGNIVPPYGAGAGGEQASIEFALVSLGIKHIIVCGHYHCGAMRGLMRPDELTEMESLRTWLKHAATTRMLVQEKKYSLLEEDLFREATRINVLVQLNHLKTHPAVAVGLMRGKVKIHGWVYCFEKGEVSYYEENSKEFRPLREMENLL